MPPAKTCPHGITPTRKCQTCAREGARRSMAKARGSTATIGRPKIWAEIAVVSRELTAPEEFFQAFKFSEFRLKVLKLARALLAAKN